MPAGAVVWRRRALAPGCARRGAAGGEHKAGQPAVQAQAAIATLVITCAGGDTNAHCSATGRAPCQYRTGQDVQDVHT